MLEVVGDEDPPELDDGATLHLPGVADDRVLHLLPLVGRHVGGGGGAEGTNIDVHLSDKLLKHSKQLHYISPAEDSIAKDSTRQDNTTLDSTTEDRTTQDNITQDSNKEDSPAKDNIKQDSTTQDRTTQGSTTQDRTTLDCTMNTVLKTHHYTSQHQPDSTH